MRSPLQTRRQSLLPVLALLGAASAALSLAPRALAIGGSAGGTSPRENSGATPTASLFQTSASSYSGGGSGGSGNSSSAEVTSRGSSSGNREEGGESRGSSRRSRARASAPEEREESSAGRRRMARRREREEGGTVASGSGRRHGEVASRDGKEGASYKDKNVLAPAPVLPKFTLSGGFETRYMFHGLDIISFNSKKVGLVRETYNSAGQLLYRIDQNRNFLIDRNGNLVLAVEDISKAKSSAIWFTGANVEYKGVLAGLTYVQAISPTTPFFQRSGGSLPVIFADGTRRRFSNGTTQVPDFNIATGDPLRLNAPAVNTSVTQDNNGAKAGAPSGKFVSPLDPNRTDSSNSQLLYREIDLNLSYTLSIVPKILDTTVGYNSYFFLNSDFKGGNYQGELSIRLAYVQFPWLRPSFTYFRYVSDYNDNNGSGNLNGNFTEFRVDSTIPILKGDRFSVSLEPYVSASYNISYLTYGNQNVGGWNTLETGLKVPVTFAKHFTVTPFGNYGLNIADDENSPINNFASRAFGEKTRFWGGVNVSYTF